MSSLKRTIENVKLIEVKPNFDYIEDEHYNWLKNKAFEGLTGTLYINSDEKVFPGKYWFEFDSPKAYGLHVTTLGDMSILKIGGYEVITLRTLQTLYTFQCLHGKKVNRKNNS